MKTVAKKASKKKAAKKKATSKTYSVSEINLYEMLEKCPREVRDTMYLLQSRNSYLASEVARLKTENQNLRSYRKFAEHRILKSEHEK